jgi:predicted nucleotidyltransferase
MDQIVELGREIGREFKPEKIILFGSHAYGHPSPDSDVDLLVVMKFKGKSAWKSLEILQRIQPPFGVDLLCRTPAQMRRRVKWNDFFLKEILAKGIVLHETDEQAFGASYPRGLGRNG